jgi:L-seryl-tRNA(Ser) seleniumtransferase
VLAAQINGLSSWQAEVLLVDSLVGGGAMPGQNLASYGVQIAKGNVSAREIENQLRSWITPIIARISEDKVMLDVRCLGEKDCQIIVDACVAREKN